MSDLDNQIVTFKASMAIAALYVNGDDQTDINTNAGPIPTLAKQARLGLLSIGQLLPDLSQRLRLDGNGGYNATQQDWGRKNLGLDKVSNIEPAKLPISEAVAAALQDLAQLGNGKEDPKNRNVLGGYFAYVGAKLPIRNGADTFFGYLFNNGTADRNWELPDKSGTVALLSDITGTNSGNNTGDETKATIKAKLGISGNELSGDNTGDDTKDTLLQKLGATALTGNNTGDEDHDSIIEKIGYDPMPFAARGANQGVAPLVDRVIPVEYLPAAFESIAIYNNFGELPNPGTTKRLYITAEDTGLYYWTSLSYQSLNAPLTSTDYLDEGTNNLYFTQLRAITSLLSTYAVGTNSVVGSSDTIVAAIGKLQGQLNAVVTNATTKEVLANKAVDFSVTNHTLYPSVLAVKTYLDTRLVGVINDRGGWSASAGLWPTTGGSAPDSSIRKGDMWFVKVSGTLGGQQVTVGDSFRALEDNPGTDVTKWDILESNFNYVPENAASKGASGGYVGMNGFSIVLKNASGTVSSLINTSATVARTWTLPDLNGTLALQADVTDLQNNKVNRAGDTVGSLDSTQPWHTTNVLKGDAGVESQDYLQAGGGAAGKGGRVIYKDDTGVQRWVDGISTTAGSKKYQLYDIVNGKLVYSVDETTSQLTFAQPPKLATGAWDELKGNDIATASTIDLQNATGNFVGLSGTVPVQTVTLNAGARRTVRCLANQQFVQGGNLQLQGGQTLNTKAGDLLEFRGSTGGIIYVIHHPMSGYGRNDKQKSLSASSATTTLDLSLAGAFKVTLAANTSLVFDMSNVPAIVNEVFSFSLRVINDATAGRGLSFPSGVKWAGGVIPPRTTTANGIDDWYFYTDDGVNWTGSLSNQDPR